MKRIMTALTLCLLPLLPVSAWSEEIVATWRHQNGNTMTLAMRDANHVRMDIDKGRYILINGEKGYMVANQDGGWTAMDMDALAGMMDRFGIQAQAPHSKADTYQSSFKDTGRNETIAGYRGKVYIAETTDASGQLTDSNEIVFCSHEDVKLASRAWMSIASRLGDIVGTQTSQEIEKASQQGATSGYGGLLRVGAMTLVGIKKPSLDAAYFDLPKEANIVDMETMSIQDKKTNDAAQTSIAKELEKEAQDADPEKAKQDTIDEVRKGVDGLFKEIFK